MSNGHDKVLAVHAASANQQPKPTKAETLAAERYRRIYDRSWQTLSDILGDETNRFILVSGYAFGSMQFADFTGKYVEGVVIPLVDAWVVSAVLPHPDDQRLICAFFDITAPGLSMDDVVAAVTEQYIMYQHVLNCEFAVASCEATEPRDEAGHADSAAATRPDGVDSIVHR